MQNEILVIKTDGGSRGNPGKAACAFVAELNGEILAKQSKFLGVATNNVAEYEGVLLALAWLENFNEEKNYQHIDFYLDSELVVRQLNGIYKIKKQELQVLSSDIKRKIFEINKETFFKNIPREANKVADFLVNEELDKH